MLSSAVIILPLLALASSVEVPTSPYTKTVTIVARSIPPALITAHYGSNHTTYKCQYLYKQHLANGENSPMVYLTLIGVETITFPQETRGDVVLPITVISGSMDGQVAFSVAMREFTTGIHDNLKFSLSNESVFTLLSRDGIDV